VSKRLRLGILALAAATALAILPAVVSAKEKQQPSNGVVELQIIHYSDWHGQLDPLFVFGEGTFGGAAELATYFRQEEANNPNTLIITGGDDFGASPPLSSFFDEMPAVLAQNLMGTDVSALGNHNFDKGVAHLQEMVNLAEYTYLGANLDNLEENVEGIEPYKIFHFPGIKVAVIGVTNEEAPTLVFPGSFGTIDITNSAEAAQRTRDRLARQGVDVFILVAHKGLRTTGPDTGELIDLANSRGEDRARRRAVEGCHLRRSGLRRGGARPGGRSLARPIPGRAGPDFGDRRRIFDRGGPEGRLVWPGGGPDM
jgi:5'-nucleotidase